jgi:hypothetical protein
VVKSHRSVAFHRGLRAGKRAVFGALALAFATAAFAQNQGFKFSNEDQEEKAKQQAREMTIEQRLSTPCREQLKNKKIMLVIGEQVAGRISANQSNYNPHYEAINRRLRALGLRTNSPEEIRRQVAQAEIDAYFKGDPDAALAASRKYGASFVLKGLIMAESRVNPLIHVNEVTVDMDFTLTDSAGKYIGDARAAGGSYSGADVRGTAAKLIDEQADEIVSKLYSDYCSNAAPAKKK